jgi:hypothetical protein
MKNSSHKLQKVLTLCLVFFLLGCGTTSDRYNNQNFNKWQISIGEKTLTFPGTWLRGQPAPEKGILSIAQKDQSIFILSQTAFQNTENLNATLLQNATTDFFQLEVLKQADQDWIFLGKLSPEDPERIYYQKILDSKNPEKTIIATCSTPSEFEAENDCPTILNMES